jgi:hypothetical protein
VPILEAPEHHRYLAAAILRRAVFDLTTRARSCAEAWEWFFIDPPDNQPANGWDFEDVVRVLELSGPHLRRSLIRAGFHERPQPLLGGQRQKVAGIIPCRICGVACAAPDVRIQRTCPACGGRLRPKYLRRRGLLSYDNRSRPSRVAHAKAALIHVLYQGPLPTRYVEQQLRHVGISRRTIERARADLRIQARRTSADGPWFLALSA